MKHSGLQFFFLYCLTWPLLSAAQVQEELIPSEVKKQTIITQPITLQKGFLNIDVSGKYETLSQSFDDNGNRTYNDAGDKTYRPASVLKVHYEIPLALTYGISSRMQVAISIPYVVYREHSSFNVTSTDSVSRQSSYLLAYGLNSTKDGYGWGDLIASGQFQVVREKLNKMGFTAGLHIKFPTGRADPIRIVDAYNYIRPVGDGETVLIPNITVRKVSYPYSFSFQFDYFYSLGGKKKFEPFEQYLQIDPGFSNREYFYRSPDRIATRLSFYIQLNDWFALGNTLSYSYQGAQTTELLSYWKEVVIPESWRLEYNPLISFQIKRYRLNQFVQFPLAGRNNSSDILFGLTIGYTL